MTLPVRHHAGTELHPREADRVAILESRSRVNAHGDPNEREPSEAALISSIGLVEPNGIEPSTS